MKQFMEQIPSALLRQPNRWSANTDLLAIVCLTLNWLADTYNFRFPAQGVRMAEVLYTVRI